MNEYDAATYDDRSADVYEELFVQPANVHLTAMVTSLAELAGGGRALELGIGTGRVALPLAAHGIEVHRIDTSQEEQVRCFRNAVEHLTGDGVFVIKAFVPDMTRFIRGQNTQTNRVEVDRVMLDVVCHDFVNQRVTGQHVVITEAGTRVYPVQVRYVWPGELKRLGARPLHGVQHQPHLRVRTGLREQRA